ncbi:RrF2 family transcriptional regulator [Thermosulfuriphilus sp.]
MNSIFKISEAASLALHAMAYLAAREGQAFRVKEIASCLGVSESHLAKVLQRLGRRALVRSTRGPKGGFTLGRPSEEISLLEIYEAIEGPLEPSDCLFETPICDGLECIWGGLIKEITQVARDHLARTRLSEVKKVFRKKASQ